MATEESISMEAMDIQGGKITFAPDVIATIASLDGKLVVCHF